MRSLQVSVAQTPIRLGADPTVGDYPRCSVMVTNEGSATVRIGHAGVTTSNGFPLAVGATAFMDLKQGEGLYGVAASGTHTVSVLQVGGGA